MCGKVQLCVQMKRQCLRMHTQYIRIPRYCNGTFYLYTIDEMGSITSTLVTLVHSLGLALMLCEIKQS